ncbi:hypothetical protein [Aquabacter cavernae]|uniref:hypothetical protein n=1 Tax=Aquabacter cavernae TaxID=2496029 RepID=UPI000F8E90FF|nr:hypothetical protein [Aquabacter cavernae]
MAEADMERLKADATGNTGLSEVLGEAVADFATAEDAVAFLASRGFDVSVRELSLAAAAAARDLPPDGEGGYGALMRFIARQ